MTIYKNRAFFLIVVVAIAASVVYLGGFWPSNQEASVVKPELSVSESFSPAPSATKTPLPTKSGSPQSGRTTFIDEAVPWDLILGQASCQLTGEIKFLSHNTYDNQDAKFIYSGIDHPARNVFWTVSPQDDISVGPNIFGRIPIPNGESLLGISLPEFPKYKKYELTAKVQYGRLVDEKGNFVVAGGNVKVFEKQCAGKTTIVLP